MKIKSFRDLIAWQKSKDLAVDIYKVTQRFPKEELFGLTNQIRRCSVSISSNITEGFGRYSSKDQYQFFTIAIGSLWELENQIIISREIGYITSQDADILIDKMHEIGKITSGLRKIIIERKNA